MQFFLLTGKEAVLVDCSSLVEHVVMKYQPVSVDGFLQFLVLSGWWFSCVKECKLSLKGKSETSECSQPPSRS